MKKILKFIHIFLGLAAINCKAGYPVQQDKAVFAGGCFWCIEAAFIDVKGIKEVNSGYTGGHTENPDYESVSSGRTGHYEAVEITFEPEKIKYEELLDIFWRQIDPTDEGGQFADRGPQYKTAVFYMNEEQKRKAVKSRADIEKSGRFTKKIATEIIPAAKFYKAEQHHQRYCKTNPERYKSYSRGSGRADFILKNWNPLIEAEQDRTKTNKPDKQKLKSRLTPMQYRVTQECGTEPPFQNEYWDNKRPGLYVDIVTGEPLFTSNEKFDSGTGWPSFTRPVSQSSVKTKADYAFNMSRVEVQSRSGSHLGHVFDDGPSPGGKRYCINSAALRFIPYEDLEKEGYGEYKKYFKEDKQ